MVRIDYTVEKTQVGGVTFTKERYFLVINQKYTFEKTREEAVDFLAKGFLMAFAACKGGCVEMAMGTKKCGKCAIFNTFRNKFQTTPCLEAREVLTSTKKSIRELLFSYAPTASEALIAANQLYNEDVLEKDNMAPVGAHVMLFF